MRPEDFFQPETLQEREALSDGTGVGVEVGTSHGNSFSQQHSKPEDLSSSISTPRPQILWPATEEICRASRPDPNPDSGSEHTGRATPVAPHHSPEESETHGAFGSCA